MAEMKSMPRTATRRPSPKPGTKSVSTYRTFADELQAVLVKDLRQAGIHARVVVEPVPNTRLHRVLITAKQFADLEPAERQDLVWRIVNAHFQPDQHLQISMMVTVTSQEWKEIQGVRRS